MLALYIERTGSMMALDVIVVMSGWAKGVSAEMAVPSGLTCIVLVFSIEQSARWVGVGV